MSLTDDAIATIRELVRSGRFAPAIYDALAERDAAAAQASALLHAITSERWLRRHLPNAQ